MRAYKVLEAKAAEVSADGPLCEMLEELTQSPGAEWGEVLTEYTRDGVRKLRQARFDPDALAGRRLKYEQIDQRLTEILLGVQ
jgi:hypothetical protein